MADQKSKKPTKRPAKGQRTHLRRLKQAARKEGNPNVPQSNPAQPVRAPKKQD